MSDFKIPEKTAKSNLTELLADSKTRTVIILFGLLGVVVIGASFMIGGAHHGATNEDSVVQAPTNPNASNVTPQYRKLVNEDNTRRARRAIHSPTASALPIIPGLSEANANKHASAKPVPWPEPVPGQQPRKPAPAPRPQMNQRAYRNALRFFAHQIKTSWNPDIRHAVVLAPAASETQASGGSGKQTGAASAKHAGKARTSAAVLVRAGSMYYGTIDTAVNSDQNGPILATIHEGPLASDRLIGKRTLEHDMLVIKFNTLSPKTGPSRNITAYAVDIVDAHSFGASGLATSVEHHFFERFVLPGAAAFLRGLGQAVSRTNTTTVVTAGGVASTSGALSTRDEMRVAAGQVGEQAVNTLQMGAQRRPTVKVAPGTAVGIVFTKDVKAPQA